jgi:hypothetical protein
VTVFSVGVTSRSAFCACVCDLLGDPLAETLVGIALADHDRHVRELALERLEGRVAVDDRERPVAVLDDVERLALLAPAAGGLVEILARLRDVLGRVLAGRLQAVDRREDRALLRLEVVAVGELAATGPRVQLRIPGLRRDGGDRFFEQPFLLQPVELSVAQHPGLIELSRGVLACFEQRLAHVGVRAGAQQHPGLLGSVVLAQSLLVDRVALGDAGELDELLLQVSQLRDPLGRLEPGIRTRELDLPAQGRERIERDGYVSSSWTRRGADSPSGITTDAPAPITSPLSVTVGSLSFSRSAIAWPLQQ